MPNPVPLRAGQQPAPANYRVIRAASGDTAEIYIYGPIGQSGGFFGPDNGVSADQFAKDLKGLGKIKKLDLRINSEGGDVFDGKAIYSLLVAHPAKVHVYIDGLAASAASFVAMAGDTIEASQGAFVMIHNASGMAWGDAREHTRTADLLRSVDETMADLYAQKTGLERAEIKQMMDDETWLDSTAALAKGFVDTVSKKPQKVAASVQDARRYRHPPAALWPNRRVAQQFIEGLRLT